MRKFLILLFFSILITSCKVNEAPEFIAVDNIQVVDATTEKLILSADAHFKNPNDVGGKLSTENIVVYVNEVETAKIMTEEFEVPAKEDFTIPLVAEVPTDSILSDKSIGGLLASLFSEKLQVRYKGDIKYKVFGFSSTYSIDQSEEVKIKL